MKERTPEDMVMREMSDMACAVRSQCEHCEHLFHVGGYNGQGWMCKAFPEKGIPIDILALAGGTASRHTHQVFGQVGDFIFSSRKYRASSGQWYLVNANWDVKVLE